jgi:UDPglucose--hexose-1-phosphate uridylyltransferase
MNEIRQNKITKQWVIYAPERGERPKDFQRDAGQTRDLPPYDPDCPFCPGNEHMLPEISMELSGDGEPWQTRVVPNKFPVLQPTASTTRQQKGIYLALPGYGRHDVIIESQRHNADIATLPPAQVNTVLETYHRRYIDVMRVHDNMLALIFRNHGPRAGTSLLHPHSQLVVTGIVPHYVRWREEAAQQYFDEWGRSVFEDILQFEQQDRRRVVDETEEFLAFVPYAAEVPFEVWIMPRRPQADFGSITDAQKADLAAILRDILARLRARLNDPDYNYIINTAARYQAGEPHLRWYVQIRPRLTTPAGFEIGSGMNVNPALPEDNADFLNAT